MNLKEFFLEYSLLFFSYFFLTILFFFFFFSLRVEMTFIILFLVLFWGFGIFWFFYLFLKKRKFYNSLLAILDDLDSKYLITEMKLFPNFLEAQKLVEVLREVDKSMREQVIQIEEKNTEFKDYIEMWIHEVKIPLATMTLLLHNQEKDSLKWLQQIKRFDRLVMQVLYYVRSETLEKDYLIKEVSLKDVVNEVIKKNKEAFILEHIKVDVMVEGSVLTDQKWIMFILEQILSNSIKYHKKNAKIVIQTKSLKNGMSLQIWDNGIGISETDLPRVFDKSFTGHNGRVLASSTGMGLYIVKKLIEKLGHKITISSIKGKYTLVTITFYNHDFFEVINRGVNLTNL